MSITNFKLSGAIVSFLAVGGFAASVPDVGSLTADGLEFTINNKNFKTKNFNVYGFQFEDTAGFTDRNVLPVDNTGYSELNEQCEFDNDLVPMHEYGGRSTAIYYPNTASFDKFEGIDFIPENKDNYYPGTPFSTELNFKDKDKFSTKPVMIGSCRLPQDDGGAWHVQRVGPFISTGGYDWWQLGWHDLVMLSEALAKYPEGIDVIRYMFVPVLKDGTRLEYPPIHIHHLHGVPAPGIRPRMTMIPTCAKKFGLGVKYMDDALSAATLAHCGNMSLYFEQHGDYQCQPEDDGIDCLMQGDRLTRRLKDIMDMEGTLNDVRPAGSEPIEWYLQIGMRWRPIDPQDKPASFVGVLTAPYMFPESNLAMSSLTYLCPSDEEAVMMVSSTFDKNGELWKLKFHAHAATFESGFVFSGTYADLGLDKDVYLSERSYIPKRTTTDLGFENNAAFFKYIMHNLEKSQQSYDHTCVGSSKNKKTASNSLRSVCSRPRPELVCAAAVDFKMVEFDNISYPFDRRPKSWCKPWIVEGGPPFVAIEFNKKVTDPTSPVSPGKISPTYPQHLALIIYFRYPDEKYSRMDGKMLTHEGLVSSTYNGMTVSQFFATVVSITLWNGFPNNSSTLSFFFSRVFWLWSCTCLFPAVSA